MGKSLGERYRLGDQLGAGAMGRVFAGSDEQGKAYAFKVLRDELVEDPELVARFLQERSILVGLRHPNLVGVHDLVVEGETVAIVMDLVGGGDLRARLTAEKSLLPAEVARIGAGVAAALAAVHQAGVVHRDVKPENVLMDGTVPRLTDFGISRLATATDLGRRSLLVGTPQYLAPELGKGLEATPASDLYSLGILLYELCCGVTPFAGQSTFAVIRLHESAMPGRPAGVPDQLWDVLAWLMAKRPSDRPDSARQVATVLDGLVLELMSQPLVLPLTTPPPPVPLYETGLGTETVYSTPAPPPRRPVAPASPRKSDSDARDRGSRRKRWFESVRPFRQGSKPQSDRSDSTSAERFLIAHLPDRAPQSAEISLVVRISRRSSGSTGASARLDRLTVTRKGAKVSVLVQTAPGLAPVGSLEQVLLVPAHCDSEPLRFTLRARSPGLHGVRVMAFAGGTFLTELELEVSVEPGGPAVEGGPAVATLDDLRGRPGEVTLQVRSDDGRTVFQLLSDSYLFEPVLAQASAGDPAAAVERTLDTVKQLVAGRAVYSPATAARWMQETGIGLWEQVVPGLIKEQFWQLRDQISSFTIATSHDLVPWELLYPLRPGADCGFLVEQFPVLRRVFGQQRCSQVSIAPCTYVVSGRSPANARQEIDALSAVLGAAGVVEELSELLDLVSSGHCGPLHFACHNSFSPQAGSSIAMNGGPFVPGLLNSATVRNSLATLSPLVFLNACRTAGSVPEYTRMVGWAQQFMAAGAGAFVGTLWPVRSESASAFAEVFYGHLQGGVSLGRAALLARRTVVREQPDPTWLAYTVYGDPHARAY